MVLWAGASALRWLLLSEAVSIAGWRRRRRVLKPGWHLQDVVVGMY
jgi:hypothetical protein